MEQTNSHSSDLDEILYKKKLEESSVIIVDETSVDRENGYDSNDDYSDDSDEESKASDKEKEIWIDGNSIRVNNMRFKIQPTVPTSENYTNNTAIISSSPSYSVEQPQVQMDSIVVNRQLSTMFEEIEEDIGTKVVTIPSPSANNFMVSNFGESPPSFADNIGELVVLNENDYNNFRDNENPMDLHHSTIDELCVNLSPSQQSDLIYRDNIVTNVDETTVISSPNTFEMTHVFEDNDLPIVDKNKYQKFRNKRLIQVHPLQSSYIGKSLHEIRSELIKSRINVIHHQLYEDRITNALTIPKLEIRK